MWTAAIVLAGVGGLLLWIMAAFSRLLRLRRQVTNGWRQIVVLLRQRHDLVPNLVLAVKSAGEMDSHVLTRLIEARNRAIMVGGVVDKAAQERELSQALQELAALIRQQPALQGHAAVRQGQQALVDIEQRLHVARRSYNSVVERFNAAQERFPTNLLAATFQFAPAVLFDLADDSPPTVQPS